MAAPGFLIFAPWQQFLDDSGNLLSSGTVSTFLAGTSTPSPLYSDIGLTTPLGAASVITLPGSARLGAYADPALSYKVIVKTAGGATVATQDNIRAASPAAGVAATELERFLLERL